LYDGEPAAESKGKPGTKPPLRTLLTTAQATDHNVRPVVTTFSQWSQARRAFLGRFAKAKTAWSPELANKVYSTQLWQLVKTWEMTQEFGLEGRGRDLFGPARIPAPGATPFLRRPLRRQHRSRMARPELAAAR